MQNHSAMTKKKKIYISPCRTTRRLCFSTKRWKSVLSAIKPSPAFDSGIILSKLPWHRNFTEQLYCSSSEINMWISKRNHLILLSTFLGDSNIIRKNTKEHNSMHTTSNNYSCNSNRLCSLNSSPYSKFPR